MKHSAARQTWETPKDSAPSFDIKARTGYWLGKSFIAGSGHHAQIYVFAYHPVTDDSVDHRDPAQWRFYVVPTERLPPSQRITLEKLKLLGEEVGCATRSSAYA